MNQVRRVREEGQMGDRGTEDEDEIDDRRTQGYERTGRAGTERSSV